MLVLGRVSEQLSIAKKNCYPKKTRLYWRSNLGNFGVIPPVVFGPP